MKLFAFPFCILQERMNLMTRKKKLKGNNFANCYDRLRWRPVLGIE